MTQRSLLPRLWDRNPDSTDLPTLQTLQREVEDLFARFTGHDTFFAGEKGRNGSLIPSLDVQETDDALTISAEMPGVEEKDIEVTIEDETLLIRGEKKTTHDESDDGYQMIERSYGTFERAVRVPRGIDPDKIDAKLANGVLSVTIPKPPEAAENKRKIDIKTAA